MINRSYYLQPRATFLGGCSGMNLMYYVRGNSQNFRDWVSYGNTEWSWDNVVQYYKKSEHIWNETLVKSAPYYHSDSGLLNVDRYGDDDPFSQDYIDAFGQIPNYSNYNDDVNQDQQMGITHLYGTIHDGTRQSTVN